MWNVNCLKLFNGFNFIRLLAHAGIRHTHDVAFHHVIHSALKINVLLKNLPIVLSRCK
jgi:hypothetical protein